MSYINSHNSIQATFSPMTDLELTQEWVNILQDKVFNKRMLGTLTRDDLDQLEYAQWCLKREQVQTSIDRSNPG